jgi:hypothetical protein
VCNYILDDLVTEVRSPAEVNNFFSILCVQTSSEAHPVSYPMDTAGPFPGGKARPGRDADHSPHLMPRSIMSRSYISSPLDSCMVIAAGQLYLYPYCCDGVRLCLCLTGRVRGSLSIPLWHCSRVNMEEVLGDVDGKPKTSEKNLSQCRFVHHKSHTDWQSVIKAYIVPVSYLCLNLENRLLATNAETELNIAKYNCISCFVWLWTLSVALRAAYRWGYLRTKWLKRVFSPQVEK